jgi:hypothetical protein
MAKELEAKHGIFSKPLPMILDEIEVATADARRAADEARSAGEKAAEEVMVSDVNNGHESSYCH